MNSSWIADSRLRPLVLLLAAAAAQIIAFWYPFYLANHYPSSDRDGRYFILPGIVLVAAALAIFSVLTLLTRVRGHSKLSTAVFGALALVASAIALWPAWRILTQ